MKKKFSKGQSHLQEHIFKHFNSSGYSEFLEAFQLYLLTKMTL